MTTPDHPDSYCLQFTSSETKPLACIAGTVLSLGQFRDDVDRLSAQLQGNGDTLINCPGRYAFSVGLLASWLNGKTVILPPNHLEETLQGIRNRFNILM